MATKRRLVVGRAATSVLEQLEQRRMLSSTVTSTLRPDTDPNFNILVVTGTKNKDYITVFDDPEDDAVTIFSDKNHNGTEELGETTEFDTAGLDGVLIDAKQGDDTVKYELVSAYSGNQRSIEVDLSDGNDKFTFEAYAGASDPVLIDNHANVNIEVDGQEKNDTIDVDLSDINIGKASVFVNIDAGAGNDKASLELPETISGAGIVEAFQQVEGTSIDYTQVQVQVDLGSGNNLYSQQVSGLIDEAEVTINVNGGSGKDTIQDDERYDLEDFSAYSFTANLQGGNDYYNGDFGNVDIESESEATYNLQGGDGNDRMTFESGAVPNGLAVVSPDVAEEDFGILGIFQVNMYGGTGNDTMDMWNDEDFVDTAAQTAKPHAIPTSSDAEAPLFIDTGDSGVVRVVMSGDAGNDKVLMNLGATEDSEGDYDLSVLGAAGKDTVAAGFEDETLGVVEQNLVTPDGPSVEPISNVTFGPSGAILVDGGRDTDTYQIVSFEDETTDPSTVLTPFSVRSCEIASSTLLPELPC